MKLETRKEILNFKPKFAIEKRIKSHAERAAKINAKVDVWFEEAKANLNRKVK